MGPLSYASPRTPVCRAADPRASRVRDPTAGRFTPDPTHTVRLQTTDTGRSWFVTLGRRTGTEDDGRPHDQPPPVGGGMGRRRFRQRRAGLCRPERAAARSGRPLAVAPADRWPSRPGWGTFGP